MIPVHNASDCFILYLFVLSLPCHYINKKAGTSPTKVWFPALQITYG